VGFYYKINGLDIDIPAGRSTFFLGLNCHPDQIKISSGYFPIIDERHWLGHK
jgi:hypothetical protein